jgi:hypothetical protein
MIFQRSIIGNSRAGAAQWAEVVRARNAYAIHEEAHANVLRKAGFSVNEGLTPQDVYQEFDNVTVERFRSDDGDTFLNDLLPLSRSVNIGRLVHKFRRASDAGVTQTSMTGQIGVKMDQVEYNYDGTLVPIHDTGFYRNWREWNAQQAEGFDALVDDQRESVAAIRRRAADSFLDGHVDNDGNIIVLDGISWSGMRADTRVAQVDLGAGGVNFDFTDTTKTYAEIEAAFKEVRDVLWITNNCEKDATYYISREIASNMERNSSEYASSENKILERLSGLMGVAAIKVSSKLSGNEFMAFPLDGMSVRPIVGMGVNTVAMPRPVYNSNYEFVVWGAIGFEVRTDYSSRKCAMFAQE